MAPGRRAIIYGNRDRSLHAKMKPATRGFTEILKSGGRPSLQIAIGEGEAHFARAIRAAAGSRSGEHVTHGLRVPPATAWRAAASVQRRLPCAKRASLLSCRHLRAERRLPTAQFRKDAPEEPQSGNRLILDR